MNTIEKQNLNLTKNYTSIFFLDAEIVKITLERRKEIHTCISINLLKKITFKQNECQN
jgi:hypothetical protein